MRQERQRKVSRSQHALLDLCILFDPFVVFMMSVSAKVSSPLRNHCLVPSHTVFLSRNGCRCVTRQAKADKKRGFDS